MSASGALQDAALTALAGVSGLNGAFDAPPVQAAVPFAVVEAGPETDWGHKSGAGREVRLALIVRDEGERATRLRSLLDEVEAAVLGMGGELNGWRVVNLRIVRTLVAKEGGGRWAGLVELRARMLAN